MSLVSVVIPAYNAAHCIERAVKSLLAQTIPVDVIVVDDGSTDGTGSALDGLAERAGFSIRVMRQQNAGAYSARVNGANVATTPYVGFMDADDFAHPDMYEKLLAFAQTHDLDIAQCDYAGKGGVPSGVREELFLGEAAIAEKVIPSRFIRGDDAVHVWDKLYRREIVQGYEPSKIMMFDDLAFNVQALARAKRIGYLHETLYDYDVNEGSSVRNFRLSNVDDLKEAIRFRKKYGVRYGLRPEDVAHARWICRNVRNMYLVACSAVLRDGVPRMEKVRKLLDLEDVRSAFAQCGRSPLLKVLRTPCAVFAFHVLKRLQMKLKR